LTPQLLTLLFNWFRLIHIVNILNRRLACTLLATAISAQLAVAAASPTSPPSKPVPAPRKELPVAFTKKTPASIQDLKDIQDHVEELAAKVSHAVVAVEVGFGSGSSVIISPDGLVLTAGHVCQRPNLNVHFTFPDGKTANGKTLGLDADSDTGLMRITNAGPWPYVFVGDLKQDKPGDWVLALGHPGGFDAKRSLVVRLGRIIRIAEGALQTDCTIAPGDSGGPLFDMSGRVIGIHTAIAASLADNFHVPITEFEDGWDQLVKDTSGSGPVKAYFGAVLADDPKGCKLNDVEKNSPAAKAGLKAGDIVLEVDDRTIAALATFRRWIAESEPGDTLRLRVKRDAQSFSAKVKLGTQPRAK
jgi:serine protease Do